MGKYYFGGMRITTKGQVTIPAHIREKAGLMPHTEVEFELDKAGHVRLRPSTRKSKKPGRGERLIAGMRGAHKIRMTTEEIMKLTRGWR